MTDFACRFDGIAYSKRDLEIAQRAACAIVPLYGDGSPGEQEAAREGRLWNDHPAIQGALRALHESRTPDTIARLTAEPSSKAVRKLVERLHRLYQDDGHEIAAEAADMIERLAAKPAGEDVERVSIARLAALHGLGSVSGARRGPPNASWTVEEWERRILECVPAAVEEQCFAFADFLLAALHPTDHIADAGKKVPTDDLRRTREAEARECAARVFDKLARKAEHPEVAALNRHHAKVIRAGEGDDYDAVQAAMNALSTVSKEREHG